MELFTVYYKGESNPNRTYFQNEVRGVKARAVRGLENALRFADEVGAYAIYNSAGKRV